MVNITIPVNVDLGNVTHNLTSKAAELVNTTGVTNLVSTLQGNYQLLIGGAILIIATFVIIHVLKNIIANAVAGLIALAVVKLFLIPSFPITPLTIVVSAFGGLGGVGALMIALFFGWL